MDNDKIPKWLQAVIDVYSLVEQTIGQQAKQFDITIVAQTYARASELALLINAHLFDDQILILSATSEPHKVRGRANRLIVYDRELSFGQHGADIRRMMLCTVLTVSDLTKLPADRFIINLGDYE